jgi:hypothetical protein
VPFAAVLAFALFSTAGFQVATAPADPPPYEGDMNFPYIQDPSGPEEYSWKVQMDDDQALEQIDDQDVLIDYVEGHHRALSIRAEVAHDAVGTNVPTTLSVSGSDIITLTVHHHAGNPLAAGTPFDYPIIAGPGWEGGIQSGTVVVKMPPDEALDAEQSDVASSRCLVPKLKGKSLKASKRRLVRAGCGVGKVTLRSDAKKSQARVVAQSPRPGITLDPDASVNLALGE